MSEAVNEAVAEALRQGVCTSASVLANGEAFEGITRAIEGLNADIGVHLNLSEGRALTSIDKSVDLFQGGALGAKAIHARPEHTDAIVAEWLAQVARVRSAGLEPSHLDTHQHVHWRPVLLGALRQVAARTGIRRVRTMGAFRPEADPVRRLLQRARATRFTHELRAGSPGLLSTDHFASATAFRALLEQGRRLSGSLELMVHPGNPAHARYADELRWLAGPWDKGLAFPVERISWRQVR